MNDEANSYWRWKQISLYLLWLSERHHCNGLRCPWTDHWMNLLGESSVSDTLPQSTSHPRSNKQNLQSKLETGWKWGELNMCRLQDRFFRRLICLSVCGVFKFAVGATTQNETELLRPPSAATIKAPSDAADMKTWHLADFVPFGSLGKPSGNDWHSCGKSPLFMGRLTINGHFQ